MDVCTEYHIGVSLLYVCTEYHIGVSLHGRVVRVSYWDGPARTGGKSIILGNATTDGWSEYHIEVSLHGRVVSVSHWGEPTWTGGQRIILGWAYMDEWSEYHKQKGDGLVRSILHHYQNVNFITNNFSYTI